MAGLRFGQGAAALGATMTAVIAILAGQQEALAQGRGQAVPDQTYHLPVAPPVYGADAYAWIDRANTLWDIIGDAPPDFGFVYGTVEPWVWITGEGYWVLTEPLTDGDGGVRGYYFRPGAREPFLARLPERSFAFENGRLVMVYDRDGRALTGPISPDDADEASWLYLRAEQLRDAAEDARRQPVDPGAWIDAQPYFYGSIEIWDDGLRYEPLWNEYRMRPEIARWRRSIELERQRRQQRAEWFLRWRRGGYVGAPPPGIDLPGRGDRHHNSGWHRVPGRWPGGNGAPPVPPPTPRPLPSPSVSGQPGQPKPPHPTGWKGGAYGAPAPGVVVPPPPGYRGGQSGRGGGGAKPAPVTAAPPAPPPPAVIAPPAPPPPPAASVVVAPPPPAPRPSPAPPRSGKPPEGDVPGGRNGGWRGGYPVPTGQGRPAPAAPPPVVAPPAPPPPPRSGGARRPVAPPPPRVMVAPPPPPPPSAYRAPPRPAKVSDSSGRGDKPDR